MTTPPRAHSGLRGPSLPLSGQRSICCYEGRAHPAAERSTGWESGETSAWPGRVTRGLPGDPSLPCPWAGGDFSRMEEGGVLNLGRGDRGRVGSGRRERVLDLAGCSSGWWSTWSPAGAASAPTRRIAIGLHASCPPSSLLTAVYLSYGSIFTKELQN